jgi:predicted nucleotidyltransferase
METQIENLVKNIEKKLQSVMKEREQAIKIIEDIVNETYNRHHQGKGKTYVGVRMYGSMATKLAIEQSDVDLTVLGLNFKGSRDLQIQEMEGFCKLLDQFLTSKSSI